MEELLRQYSEFLEEHGYLDTDWRQETPTTTERFIKAKEGGVKIHKISAPEKKRRIAKHNDIINRVGDFLLKPDERLDIDFTSSEITDKEVGVIRTLINSKFNIHTKYKNRILMISRTRIKVI